MRKAITISKLDAAKRQLETVIRLYFHDGDPVSIHTLVSAAYNVIRAVNLKRGGPRMIVKDQLLDYVKPEYQKRIRNMLNEAENFFKHADRDSDATIDFSPDQTEMMIADAIGHYFNLTGEYPPLLKVFQIWYMANHLNMFNIPDELKPLLLSIDVSPLTSMGKTIFFNEVIKLVMGQGI